MSNNNNILDGFLKDLDELNKQNVVKIKVPSTGKKLGFSLFTVAQHKELMKCAFEGYGGVIRSSIVFNDIIKMNCEDKDFNFLLCDRSYILTQLRKESLGELCNVGGVEYNLSDLPEPDLDYNVKEAIDYNGIVVNIDMPDLERDTVVSKKIISDLARIDDVSQNMDAVSIVLTYEIVKFIKSITIGDSEYIFDNFNLFESKRVVDSLPLKLNNKIIDIISNYRLKEESNITFEDGVLLEIDTSFLSAD